MSLSATASGSNSLAQTCSVGTHVEIAATEPDGGARQRADRVDDQLLAAEPRDQQHEQAENAELQIGRQDFSVDALQHLGFVEPDHQSGVACGFAHETENAPHAIEASRRVRFRIARADLLHQLGSADIGADPGHRTGVGRR